MNRTQVQSQVKAFFTRYAPLTTGARLPALLGLAALAIVIPAALHYEMAVPEAPLPHPVAAAPLPVRFADFGGATLSPQARHVAHWVADSRDNGNIGFVIVDKVQARVYVFDADARLRGDTAVLLGSARGDDTVPGIGTRPLAEVLPQERTTPAGRFVAERGINTLGEDVVWVDYDAAVSMHRVRTTQAKERRLQRLATRTAADNRISYGCINVPVAFYERHVLPIFAAQRAVIYVLPEVKTLQQVFGSYDVAVFHGLAPPTHVLPAQRGFTLERKT